MFFLQPVLNHTGPSFTASALTSLGVTGRESLVPTPGCSTCGDSIPVKRGGGSFEPEASVDLDKSKVVINVKATTIFCTTCTMAESTGVIAGAAPRDFRFLDMANQSAGSTMRNLRSGDVRASACAGIVPQVLAIGPYQCLEVGNSRGRSSFLDPVTKVLLLPADSGEHEGNVSARFVTDSYDNHQIQSVRSRVSFRNSLRSTNNAIQEGAA
jgi:hypothetical protein